MHFEYLTKHNSYYQKINVKDSQLTLGIGFAGRAGDRFHQAIFKFESKELAQAAANDWMLYARESGYEEAELGNARTGIVSTLKTPQGPGRIRLDGPEDDVYFSEKATQGRSFKQGQRILCYEVHTNSQLEIDFMFGSKLETVKIVPRTDIAWTKNKKRAELNAKDQKGLANICESLLRSGKLDFGNLKDVKPGDLIFAYEKGIHRLINIEKTYQYVFVNYDHVFTSQFKLQLVTSISSCVVELCAPLPKDFLSKIQIAMKKARLKS